jgi:hypothetical protein
MHGFEYARESWHVKLKFVIWVFSEIRPYFHVSEILFVWFINELAQLNIR